MSHTSVHDKGAGEMSNGYHTTAILGLTWDLLHAFSLAPTAGCRWFFPMPSLVTSASYLQLCHYLLLPGHFYHTHLLQGNLGGVLAMSEQKSLCVGCYPLQFPMAI